MYGAAEATARMSYLPWRFAQKKMGSIGVPIPGGKFYLQDNKKNIVAIIQARMGSQRLHEKMMLPLNGIPIIQWVVERSIKSTFGCVTFGGFMS